MVKEVCIRAVCIPASFRGYEGRSEYGRDDEPHTIGTVSMDMWTKEKGKQYISSYFQAFPRCDRLREGREACGAVSVFSRLIR